MGVRLNDMLGTVKETTVEYDDEKIALAYRPNAFTMEVNDKVNEAAERNDLSVVAATLEPVVEWWDVLDDEDQRIPATAENMRRFPLPFLMAVMDAVGQDARPEPKG